MITEQQNPKTLQIDRLSAMEIVQTINAEDKTVALAVEATLPSIALAVEAITGCFESGGRLIYLGAGTSGRLGVLDAVECLPTFSVGADKVIGIIAGGHRAITQAVEGAEDDRVAGVGDLQAVGLTRLDAVVGIAASGSTPYVLAGLEYANGLGAVTVGVSCNVPAPLLEVAQIKIGVNVGAEILTGSTRMKSGTAQKMVLNMLSTATMIRLGKVYGNLMVDLQATNEKLVKRGRRIVALIAGVDEETASALIGQAGGEVKTAIVMHKLGISADIARARLAQAKGRLRELIG